MLATKSQISLWLAMTVLSRYNSFTERMHAYYGHITPYVNKQTFNTWQCWTLYNLSSYFTINTHIHTHWDTFIHTETKTSFTEASAQTDRTAGKATDNLLTWTTNSLTCETAFKKEIQEQTNQWLTITANIQEIVSQVYRFQQESITVKLHIQEDHRPYASMSCNSGWKRKKNKPLTQAC